MLYIQCASAVEVGNVCFQVHRKLVIKNALMEISAYSEQYMCPS